MQNNSFLPVRNDLAPMNHTALLTLDKGAGLQVSKEVQNDRCHALLTGAAMENVMTLSAIEAHCNQVAPLGAHRYKLIADAYAMSAAARIARW